MTVVETIKRDLDAECKAKGMHVNWDMYLEKEKLQMYLPTNEEIEKINPYSYGRHHSGGKYDFWIVAVEWIIHHIKSKREGKIK
jgi:hypothetical protein